jgi:nicotinate-nucleotide adenylyltransferase
MKKLQNKVKDVFERNFGYTPLNERLKDINREFFELMKWRDVKNLKEESGDLLASLIQLHNESGWDIEENLNTTLDKIESRYLQYSSLGRKTKVAILGGAFDPVTNGHIQIAKFVLNTSGEFDEVWLMPAYKHMYNKEMLSSDHRIKMCELAAQVDGRIKVFDYEIKNKLAGETYNFFKRLHQEEELNKKYNFSMIIGMDNANTFDKWVNYQELERMVRFVVVPREGYNDNTNNLGVNWYLKEPHIFLNNEVDIMKVSSTEVRNILKNEGINKYKAIDGLVDKNVLSYIYKNKLYDE